MKAQLQILAVILIVVFFSTQPAVAATIDTSASVDETHPSNFGKNGLANTTIFLPMAITPVNYANSILAGGFNSAKRSKSSLTTSLVGMTTIPLFISPGNIKTMAFLSLAKEKVVFGAPSHKRFSYPAIAFRIKF